MRFVIRMRRLAAGLLLMAVFCMHSALAGEQQSLFWAIESGHERAGYLLGTIHSEDPRVLEFTEEFLASLRGSSMFAMELVPDLPTLARLAKTLGTQGRFLGVQ